MCNMFAQIASTDLDSQIQGRIMHFDCWECVIFIKYFACSSFICEHLDEHQLTQIVLI